MENRKLLIWDVLDKCKFIVSESNIFNYSMPYDNLNIDFNLWHKEIELMVREKYFLKLNIFLFFENWEMVSLPTIFIQEHDIENLRKNYPFLTYPLPHFSISNKLLEKNSLFSFCYVLHDRIEIPRNNFLIIIDFIENQFKTVFEKLILKDKFLEERKKEFNGIWITHCLHFNLPIKKPIPDSLFSLNIANQEKYEKLNCYFTKINQDNKYPNLSKIFKYKEKTILKDIIDFLKSWNKNTYTKIEEIIINQEQNNFLIIIEFKNYFYGIKLLVSEELKNSLKFRKYSSKSLNSEVDILVVNFLDIDFIVSRNLKFEKSNPSLKNLSILQIGAGAIGGYLADGLVKIGAGLSNNHDIKGNFTLLDKDKFSPENIGRHILGYKYINTPIPMPKAISIINYIYNSLPSDELNLKDICSDITLPHNNIQNNNYDLIIDATGEFEVAEYINEQILKLPLNKRPYLLHLWIFGNGECVQALWVDPNIREKKWRLYKLYTFIRYKI